MYHEQNKRLRYGLAVLAAAAVVTLLCLLLVPRIRRDLDAQSRLSVRDAVLKSAAQCYAVEGVYPASLEHLEESYGLTLNHERYYITYQAYSSNLPPDVQVLEK